MQRLAIYDMDRLIAVVTKNSFKICEKGSYVRKPFTHEQMKAMLDRRILDKKVLDGFYQLSKYLPECGSEIFFNMKRE